MSEQDDYLRISTPENIAFGYPLAGIGSRFIAALVDTALILLLQAVVLLLSVLLAAPLVEQNLQNLTGFLLAVLGLISFSFLWGYYIFFEVLWNGQSPGKRITHMRVIRIDGAPISLPESAIRNLIRFIDFLPLFYGVGIVTMFIDPRARRLGDLAAGTLVVREKGVRVHLEDLEARPIEAPGPRFVLEGYGEIPVDLLTEEDVELVRAFLDRQRSLSNDTHVEKQIAEYLLGKMSLQAVSLDQFQRAALLKRIAGGGSGR